MVMTVTLMATCTHGSADLAGRGRVVAAEVAALPARGTAVEPGPAAARTGPARGLRPRRRTRQRTADAARGQARDRPARALRAGRLADLALRPDRDRRRLAAQ